MVVAGVVVVAGGGGGVAGAGGKLTKQRCTRHTGQSITAGPSCTPAQATMYVPDSQLGRKRSILEQYYSYLALTKHFLLKNKYTQNKVLSVNGECDEREERVGGRGGT